MSIKQQNLKNEKLGNKLQQTSQIKPEDKESELLKKYAKNGLTVHDVVRIKECFDVFDADKSQNLSKEEILSIFSNLKESQKKTEFLDELKEQVEARQTSKDIGFEEFLSLFGFTNQLDDDHLRGKLFQQVSLGKDIITPEDLNNLANELGTPLADDEIEALTQGLSAEDGISQEKFDQIILEYYEQKSHQNQIGKQN